VVKSSWKPSLHSAGNAVVGNGKGLEPLCDALERIRSRPEKYQGLGKNEGVIEDIEIKNLAGNE
jgi:hypothetical protein